MLSGLAAFLTSSAGGAILGFFLDWMQRRQEGQERAERAERDKEFARHGQVNEHAAALDRAQTAELHPRTRSFFWGLYTCTEKVAHYPPRARVVAYALWLLVTTYCAILLLWAGNPWAVIQSIAPDLQPTRWGIPFLFMVEHSPTPEPIEQNAGGIVYGFNRRS